MEKWERFNLDQRREIWDRFEAGESVSTIAGTFDRFPSAVRELVLRSGGVRPLISREMVRRRPEIAPLF